MSRVRIEIDIESESTSDLLRLVREALRNYGGFPEPRSEGDSLPEWTLTQEPLDPSPDACECCGCTAESPCEDGCSWDVAALAKGRLICTRCMSRVTTVPETPPGPPRVHVPGMKDGAVVSTTVEMSTSPGAGSAGEGSPPPPVQSTSDEAIRSLLEEGFSVPEVARIVGLSAATIYARRKKLGITPPAKRAKRGANKAAWRCGHCSHVGQDPIRCDHCFERRQ